MDALRPLKIMLLRQAAAAIEGWLQEHAYQPQQTLDGLFQEPSLLLQIVQTIPHEDPNWQRLQTDTKAHFIIAKLTHDDYDFLLWELGREGGPCEEHGVALGQPKIRPRFNAEMDKVRDWLLHPESHPLPPSGTVSSS